MHSPPSLALRGKHDKHRSPLFRPAPPRVRPELRMEVCNVYCMGVSVTKPTFTSNIVEAVADVGSNAYHRIAELETINADLLAALELAQTQIVNQCDVSVDEWIACKKTIRSAISKAKGKPCQAE